ncbi:MAG TPA: ketopantoate reductase family protein [Gaiellaceae bacterium]|nr:ketopantoate reductase family protein [Gaiellaceae bacterium]
MSERVCIVGGGVIGSLYAAHLASVADVWVLTRREEHAAALEAEGLRVSGKHDFTARLRATADPEELPEIDLVVLATKATQLEEAAAALAGRVPGATVMTVQNGLGAEEIVRRHGDWPLVSAVTFMSGERHTDTHVEYELDTATWLGPFAGTATPFERVVAIEELLHAGGLEAEAFPDLLPAQWSKLVFNATVNSVAALTCLGHVDLFAREEEPTDLGHLVHALMVEGVRVAAAAGVEVYEDPWEMNVLAVRRGETHRSDYAHVPSMLADVRAERPTEVDFITGALVREAERLGVEVPLHAAMYRLVKGREAAFSPRESRATGVSGQWKTVERSSA